MMKTRAFLFSTLLALASLLAWTPAVQAQTLNASTLNGAVGATDSSLVLTSAGAATGSSFGSVAVGQQIYVLEATAVGGRGETMQITSVSGTTIGVQRRDRPRAHPTGALVFIGAGSAFQRASPAYGACTSTSQVDPWINIDTGVVSRCVSSLWTVAIGDDAYVGLPKPAAATALDGSKVLSVTGGVGGATTTAATAGGIGGTPTVVGGVGGAGLTSGAGGAGGAVVTTGGVGGTPGTTGAGGAGGALTPAGGVGGVGGTTSGTGGVGGAVTPTGGVGGAGTATTAAGGVGGAFTAAAGAGGAGGATGTGGAGGAASVTGGAGTTSAASGGTGGAGGALVLTAGAGGVDSTGAATGGAGAAASLTGGAGGGTITGGAGGAATVKGGAGANGSTAGGSGGDVVLQAGAVGTGGTGSAGTVKIKDTADATKVLSVVLSGATTATTTTLAASPAASATLTLPGTTGGLPVALNCGATGSGNQNCSATAATVLTKIYAGSSTMSSNAAVITFPVAFAATTSYQCLANDITTRANVVQMISTSTTTATITNTTGASDVINWICVGQ